MIKSVLLLSTFLVLVFTGCRDFSVSPEDESSNTPGARIIIVSTAGAFEMTLGDTARLEGTDLSITFTNVLGDSRCPANVQCIQAGEAEILMEVQKGNGDSGEIQLVSRIPGLVRTPYENGDVIQFEGFRYQLLQLSPYPLDGGEVVKESDYRALISISPVFN